MANVSNRVRAQATATHVDDNLKLEFHVPPGDVIAMEVDKEMKNVPEGYAVIVLGYGEQAAYMYPQSVSLNGETIWVPRASRRAIPLGHLNVLLDAKETRTIQPKPGAPAVEYEANRFDVQILKLPKDKAADMKEKIGSIRERAERQQIHVG